MTTSFQNLRRPVAFCCLLVLCGFAMSGCIFDKTVIQSGPTRPGQTQVPGKPAGTAQPGAGDAENAWNAGQAARAEQIATRLLSQPGLSIGDTARVARVLALSASAGGHPYLAMTALERWLGADRNADASPEWRTVFMAVLGQLPPRDAAARAMGVVENPARPLPLRADAALFLASRQWEREQGGPQALADLRVFYTQVPERADRAQMERSLFARLRDIDGALLANLDVLVTEENRKDYPYALVRLETLRRKALHAATREEAKEGAALLAEGSALADPAILGVWDAPEQPPAAVATPIAGRTLVLALPLSGGLGSIGMKVSQGAEAARKEFADSGHSLGLVTLDTQRPDWPETLAALPPDAAIVGGPLQTSAFAAAHARGLTRDRVFLAFTSSLGEAGEEGRVGWRFFPSPEDQLNALSTVTKQLAVMRYAIVMPDSDPYSQRMAKLFAAHVAADGGDIVKQLEYPGKEPEKWNKLIGSFLGADKKATRAPATPFQAVFLPDSWRNMELIVPNFFYFLEPRQLLLGTSLWEQGLAGTEHVAGHYYKLAVFPGAWNKNAPTEAGQRLYAAYARAGKGEPDFWAGLGYDFVRFAALLDIPKAWNAETVNAALSRDTGMAWSMAPITWSAQGRASQHLFLFSPTEEGFAPADLSKIAAGFNKAWGR